MRLYGLIGFPLAQSFSKKYFTEKFERERLADCHFENFAIEQITNLEWIVQANPTLLGLAVTIPYKQTVIAHLDSDVDIPAALQACNCIKINNGKLRGYNTDYIGFEKSFVPLLQPYHTRALVLGNGGSAAAVRYVLQKIGIEHQVVSRKIKEGSTLTYNDLNEDLIREYTVIINTTPLGMFPLVQDCAPIPYNGITQKHYLFDLIYNPVQTTFLAEGLKRGAVVKNGADMLVLQAEENWRIWNS